MESCKAVRAPRHLIYDVTENEDTSKEFARDLCCGLSVYAGFDRKTLNWVWSVEGNDVCESGIEDTFELAEAHAKLIARKLLHGSVAELKRGR